MNDLVKILSSDDGYKIELKNQVWHYVVTSCGGSATLCEGEYFGMGESGCEYEGKRVKRGGITCPKCISIIKDFKAIKI